ncbi:MAG: PqqD family protein [Lachnospira sp.]|nr:PqqD family protein [Lachnospira sp.]
MKIKEGFILRSVGSENVVVAVGEQSRKFNGMIRLNNTGKFLWELLKEDRTEEFLADELVANYDIDREQATADVKRFAERLKEAEVLA